MLFEIIAWIVLVGLLAAILGGFMRGYFRLEDEIYFLEEILLPDRGKLIVRIPDDLYDKLELYTNKEGCLQSEIVTEALKEYLK